MLALSTKVIIWQGLWVMLKGDFCRCLVKCDTTEELLNLVGLRHGRR